MTTSSTLRRSDSLPKLSEAARHVVIPEGIVLSAYPRVRRRLLEAGVEFDPWQQGFATIALGCREDGKYAATVGGVVASIPRQVGKALDLDTELLTANRGWTTFREVRVGDVVFHPSGARTAVTEVHPVMDDHECFEVVTSDGRSVIADAEHLWTVVDKRRERSRGSGTEQVRWFETRTLSTRELVTEGLSRYQSGGRESTLNGRKYRTNEYRFQLPEQGVVDLPESELPVDPYLFGAWLGDGVTTAPRMASGDEDLQHWIDAIRDAGFIPRPQSSVDRCWDIGVGCEPGPGVKSRSFGGALRRLGALGRKHIPDSYLLGSTAQRLALLQGLLDTDGHIDDRGVVEFCGTSQELAAGVLFLARSLGWRAGLHEGQATISGRDCGTKYRVTFTPKVSDGMVPFRLARKAQRVGAVDGGKGRKTVSIKEIRPVESRPVRCIKVETNDGLFLAGRDLVATHNTFTVGNIIIGLCLEFPGSRWVWTSHHLRTTTNTFRSFQGMVKRKEIAPHLLPNRSNGIREANGEQEIRFRNGSIILFGARAQGFGRGIDEIDGEVFDEAQILGLKALEDMVPATNQARHPHGALIFFLGTPPRPTDDGEAFTAKRAKALKGKPEGQVVWTHGNQVYVEFSAAADTEPDDPRQFPVMNPSFPHRTPLVSMQRMRENIPDDDAWNREARGIWPASGMGVFGIEQWNALLDTGSAPPGRVVLSIAVAQDRGWACIAAAGEVDGKTLVMCHSMRGLGGVAAKVVELRDSYDVAEVALVGAQAKALQPDLVQAGVEFEVLTGADEAASCAAFQVAVKDGTVTHLGQVELDMAVRNARTRMSGESERWDRKDVTVDDSPLVAVSGAFYRWGLVYEPNYDVMESIL